MRWPHASLTSTECQPSPSLNHWPDVRAECRCQRTSVGRMRQEESEAFGSRYTLGPLVGRGAMGRVHRASATNEDAPVAVKLLRDDLASEPEVIGRFLQESHLLRSVHHPNVVGIHDLVAESGRLGIVMDFVSGGDLRSAVPFPTSADHALDITAQIAAGLSAVHEAGIIHRDLKPENVLAERPGGTLQLKITDFGISRLMAQASRATSLIGTPVYMAPELGKRDRPTPAVDIYALGVILYEALTGRVPFEADSHYALVRAHIEDPVPRPIGLPEDIWELLLAMLAKSPSERPSAAEVGSRAVALSAKVGKLGPFQVPENRPTEIRPRPDGGHPQQLVSGASPTSKAAKGTEQPASRKNRRMWSSAAAAVLLIGGAVTVWATTSGGDAVPNASPGAVGQYSFKPVATSDGAITTRQWELSGSILTSTVVITNSGTTTAFGDHYEVIPKSVAGSVDDITFVPGYTEVVQADPVVRYSLDGVEPGAQLTFTWTVDLGDKASESDVLTKLADDQQTAEAEFQKSNGGSEAVALAALSLDPASASLTVGDSVQLKLAGTMSDGSAAADQVLLGVSWASTTTGVATVDDSGRVTAVAEGSADITVAAGDVKATAHIAVDALPTATTTTTKPTATTIKPPPTTAKPTTTTTGPTAPSAPSINGTVSDNNINWSWSTPSTGNRPLWRYDVYINGGLVYQGTNTSYNQAGGQWSTTYTLRVVVFNSGGLSAEASLARTTASGIGSVSIGVGGATTAGGCVAGDGKAYDSTGCYFVAINLSGWSPGQHTVRCYMSMNSGSWSQYDSFTTDNGSHGGCSFSSAGRAVIVAVDTTIAGPNGGPYNSGGTGAISNVQGAWPTY